MDWSFMPDHYGGVWGYFDHAATSPLRPEVRKALQETLESGGWGNPSSVHSSGRKASRMVEEAREVLGKSIGADPRRITFTSGATEANHAGLMALGRRARAQKKMVILSSPLEHPSILGALRELEALGHEIHWVEVSTFGVARAEIEELIQEHDPGFLVCMAANNETGAVQPWEQWAATAKALECPLHCDATQLWGKWSNALDHGFFGNWVISGHKRGTPSGVGALVSQGVGFEGWLGDGPQERGRRGGTENLLGIHCLGVVAGLSGDVDPQWATQLEVALDRADVKVTVPQGLRLPGHLHLQLPVRADLVLQRLDLQGFAVSTGSACASGSLRPSRVLKTLGWTDDEARRALRISTGWTNSQEDVTSLAAAINGILDDLI